VPILALPSPNDVLAQDYAGNLFTSFHNLETFEKNGEQIRAVRIPIYLTLRPWEPRNTGLRLRLAASFAASDLFELFEKKLEQVRIVSFVPGVEFVFPLGDHHLLRPFLDAGIGSDDATKNSAFLGSLGLRTEFLYPREAYIFGLEPGLQFSFSTGLADQKATILNPFITLSARRVLGTRLADYPPDLGIYFEAGYNFNAFEVTSVNAAADHIQNNFEVGLGFGYSHGRPRLGPFPVPRFRIGYRFGDLEGFRIRFGGDWLKAMPK
jgi:hypothetical protein